jgi:hypothetical protein
MHLLSGYASNLKGLNVLLGIALHPYIFRVTFSRETRSKTCKSYRYTKTCRGILDKKSNNQGKSLIKKIDGVKGNVSLSFERNK